MCISGHTVSPFRLERCRKLLATGSAIIIVGISSVFSLNLEKF